MRPLKMFLNAQLHNKSHTLFITKFSLFIVRLLFIITPFTIHFTAALKLDESLSLQQDKLLNGVNHH